MQFGDCNSLQNAPLNYSKTNNHAKATSSLFFDVHSFNSVYQTANRMKMFLVKKKMKYIDSFSCLQGIYCLQLLLSWQMLELYNQLQSIFFELSQYLSKLQKSCLVKNDVLFYQSRASILFHNCCNSVMGNSFLRNIIFLAGISDYIIKLGSHVSLSVAVEKKRVQQHLNHTAI